MNRFIAGDPLTGEKMPVFSSFLFYKYKVYTNSFLHFFRVLFNFSFYASYTFYLGFQNLNCFTSFILPYYLLNTLKLFWSFSEAFLKLFESFSLLTIGEYCLFYMRNIFCNNCQLFLGYSFLLVFTKRMLIISQQKLRILNQVNQ